MELLDSPKTSRLHGVQIGEVIGAGQFGQVYKGQWQGNPVALKNIKSQDLSEFQNELSLLVYYS